MSRLNAIFSIGLTALLVILSVIPASLVAYSATTGNSNSYPLATSVYVRIDPNNNEWYANVTNIGTQPITIDLEIYNSGVWETVNGTGWPGMPSSLSPGQYLTIAESCYDPYTDSNCSIAQTNSMSVSAETSGTSGASYQYDYSQNVTADNLVHSAGNYPGYLFSSGLKITPSKWDSTVTNLGTNTGTFRAIIQWSYDQCKKPAQCSQQATTKNHSLHSGKSFSAHGSITKFKPTVGDDADIQTAVSYTSANVEVTMLEFDTVTVSS